MGVDVSPGNVAIQQLSSIPFGTLIGAPLTAAVRAQAESAMATVDFILKAGMNEDADGNKVAVTVSFSYQDSRGITRVLTVPLLAIVHIPSLLIDDMQIAFKANIQAGTTQEQTSTTSVATETSTSAQLRYLWWASGQFNAKFSAKKDSTASQNSRYDVEYTMDINLRASQADEPQGLLQILNILNEAITARDPEGDIVVVLNGPTTLSSGNPSTMIDLIAVSGNNEPVPGATITLAVPATLPDGVTLTMAQGSGTAAAPPLTATTNEYGRASVTITATAFPAEEVATVPINLSMTLNGNDITGSVSITIEPSVA